MSNIDLHSLYLKYDTVGTFHEGLVLVSKAGKYFHACEDSTPAYSERYAEIVLPFCNGQALVSTGTVAYSISRDGKKIIEQ